MWWAMWCAAVVAASARAAPASDPMPALDLLQIEPAPDDVGLDAASFAPGQLRGHYGAGGDAPWLYLFADMPHDSQSLSPMERQVRSRPKRKMPSLSINNPMEVLRQRLLLEVARKQMREASQRQAVANRLFLQNVGKRGFWPHEDTSRYGN